MRYLSDLRKIFRTHGYTFLIIILFGLGTFFRLYNFQTRLIFGPEQAMSLITTGQMIKEKFSLLGEAYIQRTTSTGLYLFHSALFSYSLIPLEIIFKFKPLPITIFFTLLNIATGLLLYFLVKKATNPTVAWFSAFLFLLNSKMIHHSLFIWTINYLPLVGLTSSYLMWKLYKNKNKSLPIFLLGVLSGIGFGLQYVYVISALLIFVCILFLSNKKLLSFPLFFIGAVIGDLPMVLFDLKHNFYHLYTLYRYFLDTQAHRVSGFYTYYQFLNFWPVFAITGGILLATIFKKNKTISIVILLGYLFFNITSPYARIFSGTISRNDITLDNLKHVASVIANDKPPELFNAAVLLDFDTQAHPLRYMLTYQYNLKLQPVGNYSKLSALYVLAPNDYDMKLPKVWELQTFMPYKTVLLDSPTLNHKLYKLTK